MEEGRRRPTLSHQMSVVDRSTLRNFTKLPDEDDEEEEKLQQQQQDNQTIASILRNGEKQEMPAVPDIFPPGRTLLDIIGEEESSSAVAYKGMIGTGHRINWKSFKDRLRVRRTGAAWSSSGSSISVSADFTGSVEPRPTIEIPHDGRGGIVREFNVPSAPAPAPAPAGDPVSVDPGQMVVVEEVEPPAKVSLMSLLQADSQDGSIAEEEEEDEADWGETGEYVCCVCMVRHKGAAFIPCGHTFCRLCSRELWVSRGNCPLCNGYILEILDIF